MTALIVELRTNRMLIWGLVSGFASIVFAFFNFDRWFDSVGEASIAGVTPLLYVGALIVAGAADTERLRATTSHGSLITISGRPSWQPWGARLLVITLYGAILPVVLPSVTVIVTAQFGAHTGVLTLDYIWATVLFTFGACLLGTIVGSLVRSRVAAVLIGFALGLVLSMTGRPVPPVNLAWQEINPTRVGVLAGVVAVLVAAVFLVVRSQTQRRRFATGAGTVLTVTALAVLYLFGSGIPEQRERVSADPGVCDHSGSFDVCVWPGDEFYLSQIVGFTPRFASMNERLGGPPDWTIAQPGLLVDGAIVHIEPMGEGDGLWLVAESFTFALANSLTWQQCDYGEMSQEELDELNTLNWALAEAMTNYVYGEARPESIRSGDVDLDRQVREIADPLAERPEHEQLEWIEETWQIVNTC